LFSHSFKEQFYRIFHYDIKEERSRIYRLFYLIQEASRANPMTIEGFKREIIAMLSIGIKRYTAAEPKEER